jgi:hypothetical protein
MRIIKIFEEEEEDSIISEKISSIQDMADILNKS